MIVLKFGGTSVGSAARVREAAAIARAQPEPRVVVVSAASGVTNLLLDAARAAAHSQTDRRHAAVAAIHAKHAEILTGVDERERASAQLVIDDLHGDLDASLDRVAAAGELSPRASDEIVAIGEKSLSVLMAAMLRSLGTDATHIFAERVVATDGRHGGARPDRARTREQAQAVLVPLLAAGTTVVLTGFVGGAPDGSTTTLGRGGSDYSATLIGAALDADEVQIWTDVPGVLSADPRQVPAARVVDAISYDEAQELAHFGAKVLHPRTIRPAVARGIPVRILSTFAPDEPGTTVTRHVDGNRLKAVTALRGLILLTLDVPELEDLSAAAAAVFRTLHDLGVEVISVSQASSRRRMTYLIDAVTGGCTHLQARLREGLADLDATVNCAEQVATLAAVGEGAAGEASSLSRMLAVLDRANVPVLAANQQASNVALLAVVPEDAAARGVAALHDALIRPEPASTRGKRPHRRKLLAESLRVG
ncbi:MAG: aspartate kinase [Chloroflexota bacterium]|nr:aspartate kinase [Chloroflexota bacterium]